MRIEKSDYELNRRIHFDQVIRDNKHGVYRPGSGCFDDTNMSVDLVQLLESPCDSLKNYPNCCLAVFAIELAQRLELVVMHNPIENNFAHCEVVGKKTPSKQKRFAMESRLLCYVPAS